METYKQEIKEKTREIIWKHAITSLTNNRRSCRILNSEYMEHLWGYSKIQIRMSKEAPYLFNEDIYQDWTEFADITYQNKKVSELKIGFFCGPEPENDVRFLIEKGVRVENIYAFEYDKKIFNQAVNSLHSSYPRLKIYNGKIEDFIQLNSVVFDIIYLDFTRSLLKEFKTVFKLISNNSLSELSVLVVNTTIPEKTEDNINQLANYFFYNPIFEYGILNDEEDDYSNNEDSFGKFREGCTAYGICSVEELKPYIERNFTDAYSAFQTHFIISYSNLIKPIHSVVNKEFLFKRIFNSSETDKLLKNSKSLDNWELRHTLDSPLIHQQISSAFSKEHFFSVNDVGCKYSIQQATYLFDLYDNAEYDNYHNILSNVLQKAIPQIHNNIIGARNGLFCDVPMIHLWLELIINQYGSPYHFNMQNHKRYKYTSKQRDMYFDIFTLDRCRSLYDWLPIIEYYGDDLSCLERQIVSRMCIDAIGKHTIFNLNQQYYGSALIGLNEKKWSKNHFVPVRETL